MRELGIGPDRVNVNGGAIALGHPIGASGARIALHLALELRRRGGGLGAAALCGGGGQGNALLLECPRASERADLGPRGQEPARAWSSGHATATRGRSRGWSRWSRTVAPELRAVMRGTGPADRAGPGVGLTGAPGVGKSTVTGALVGAPTGSAASGSACSRSTRPPRSPAARCSATGSGCSSTPPTRACSSGRWPAAGTWAGWPGRRRRRCGCWTRPASTLILVETVGVGQAEVEIAALADSTLVIVAPGLGDAIQAAKAGILEIGDVFVVNKSDKPGAQETVRDLRGMIAMAPARPGGLEAADRAHRRAGRRGHRRAGRQARRAPGLAGLLRRRGAQAAGPGPRRDHHARAGRAAAADGRAARGFGRGRAGPPGGGR